MSKVNSYSDERRVIESRLRVLFKDPDVPLQFDNMPELFYNTGEQTEISKVEKFVRLNILSFDSTPIGISEHRDRQIGEVQLTVFVKQNIGSQAALEIADDLYSIYNRQTDEQIRFRSTYRSPPVSENGWFQIALSTPFEWDRCA